MPFEGFPGVACGIAGVATTILVIAKLLCGPNLDAIPTVGPKGWQRFWWAGVKYLFRSFTEIVQEGYEKYPSMAFKFYEQFRLTVIVSSRQHIEEIGRAPNNVFSLGGAVDERLNTDFTLGPDVHRVPFHVTAIRSQLTRNLGTLFPDIMDEIVTAFSELLDLKGNEWKSVPALDTTRQVVCRASNRLFGGLPLCRDSDWIDLNIRFTIDAIVEGTIIGLFPKFMKPLVAYFITGATRRGRARCLKRVRRIIEERLMYLKEYGMEWDGQPNDLISWLIEEANDAQLTIKSLASRLMVVNFAAIHTSSNSFAHALFYLAANPQYIQPLCEEIEAVVAKDGWSKDSLSKMHKVDSFMRESQRLEGVGHFGIMRKALKDFTFSDGTFIPKGTMIGAAAKALHYDDKLYENANMFDPFRFANMHEESARIKCQFTSPAAEYLSFGYGRNAWEIPGRFFAANEMKFMLAHVVATCDVKLEGDGTRPPNYYALMPNPHAKVLFRKRVD